MATIARTACLACCGVPRSHSRTSGALKRGWMPPACLCTPPPDAERIWAAAPARSSLSSCSSSSSCGYDSLSSAGSDVDASLSRLSALAAAPAPAVSSSSLARVITSLTCSWVSRLKATLADRDFAKSARGCLDPSRFTRPSCSARHPWGGAPGATMAARSLKTLPSLTRWSFPKLSTALGGSANWTAMSSIHPSISPASFSSSSSSRDSRRFCRSAR
mmetsp:Transcript_13091/g.41397  ORF Transcript_13091/g.41397 Transcript_13091/m.41397 type:complete len:218 (+) Transcript_13091:398-1051(+)